MKIQLIEIGTNELVDEIENSKDLPFLPRIGELVTISSGPWIVKGLAHMWDDLTIKIMVKSAIKK
jgi:hypothetical protein